MNILMVTNTFTPHVGGVARSVEAFTAEYRRLGHRTIVVAPTFDPLPAGEKDVIRLPAIQHFNGSDFAFPVPVPGLLFAALSATPPDIVHSHHPFLLGDTALRLAAMYHAPVVFTHHTLYDQYTHYLGGEWPVLARMATEIGIGYCNLCQGVIAPSRSLAGLLREQGARVPLAVIPTGVDLDRFAQGNGPAFRARVNIPVGAFVVGHVGRLAPEKNLEFLTAAVAEFLMQNPQAYFLVVGAGPLEQHIQAVFEEQGLADRLRMSGVLAGKALASAYRAMDVFAFSSQSETQGLVLAEALAAGSPVVALDGPGVRDVVVDGENGRLLAREDVAQFARALEWTARRPATARRHMQRQMRHAAERFSMPRSAARALAFYRHVRSQNRAAENIDDSAWATAMRWLQQEWKILAHHARAVGGALAGAVTAPEAAP